MPLFNDIGISTIYNGTSPKTNVIVWNGQATTSGGVATFNPTDDGTGTGNALFTNIYAVHVTPERNTGTATDVTFASVKLVAADKKSITVNVADGIVLVALGATIEFAPDGTNVYMTIIGD